MRRAKIYDLPKHARLQAGARAVPPEQLNSLELLSLCAILILLAAALALMMSPRAHARKSGAAELANSSKKLPKSLAGNLHITQLTENEAILHALNRLAYGPRPGDVERIRKMGLEKWIDEQLSFTSGRDPALDAKLSKFKTLKMS
ncbi:MAG TPA: DUF1800 family protein, partial [Candidatus Acidoferrales bacterium]|nr:DUF1800 family protein [Candidatus Acidoferrales bacterium]